MRIPRFLSRWTVLAACLVGGLLGLAGCVQGTVPAASEATEITRQATATSQATAVPSTQPANASAADLEDRLGVQVTLVAVTAGGGLLDLRFQVTDPAKAAELFRPENAPAVIAPERGVTIQPPQPPDPGPLTEGQVYYLLYPNSGGAVRPGSTVILAFGDLRLEAQVAP